MLLHILGANNCYVFISSFHDNYNTNLLLFEDELTLLFNIIILSVTDIILKCTAMIFFISILLGYKLKKKIGWCCFISLHPVTAPSLFLVYSMIIFLGVRGA